MSPLSKIGLFWAPRLLSIAFIAYLSMFALDVFDEGLGFWRTLAALAIHLIPSFVLLVVLLLAWRWEWIGAALFGTAGLGYILGVMRLSHPAPMVRASWVLVIAGPAIVIAGLFLANWARHDELRTR
jgi:hypothetical protein